MAATSIYDFEALSITGKPAHLSTQRGKVLLIVNTASACGFTPQFKGLEQLWQDYREQGLVIVGFPSNEFGGQDPGANDEIASFCEMNYGVSFPMMSKVQVNGAQAHPLWQWLKAQAPGLLGSEGVKWNFTKFLVGRDGRVLKRYAPNDTPESLRKDIDAALMSAPEGSPVSVFDHLEPYAGDPILSLNDAFQKDPRRDKINLSIGIYFDDAGRIPVLDCVHQAEQQMLAENAAKPYLPIEGAASMRAAVQQLLFGAGHEALSSRRIATLQTVGSSGGLRVGADFIKRWMPDSQLWLSDPSWDNHRAMFEGAGLTVNTYPYYDPATGGLKFDAMLATLQTLPARSIVLLHACCHNPTGVDLTREQWSRLVPVLRERQLLPYLDLAYQGYGDGIEEDAFAARALASSGLSFFIANSFSKSMSVYGERAGALSVVCADAAEAELVLGQMKATVRRNYSSPSIHAAGVVSRVLTDPKLRASWEADVAAMRERIQAMRRSLHGVLRAKRPERDFGYFLSQRGMFSYTGLSGAQVDRLREEFGVYLVRSGRMCIAGLNTGNVERTAMAMAAVI